MRLQLQHQHRMMQQHQQQLRHQRQATTPARQGSTPPSYNGNHFQGQTDVTSPLNPPKNLSPSTNGDKLVQPTPNVIPSCARDINMPVSGQHSADMDVSEEELKDLLSQKDLATTLAENLLKHFGSDDIDIKEEQEQSGESSFEFFSFKNQLNQFLEQTGLTGFWAKTVQTRSL